MNESYKILIDGVEYGTRDTLDEVIELLRAVMLVYEDESRVTFSVERIHHKEDEA